MSILRHFKICLLPTVWLWLVVVGSLGGLLLISNLQRDVRNDPDPALQRPGILLAPTKKALPLTERLPASGRKLIVLFQPTATAPLFRDKKFLTELMRQADVALVIGDATKLLAIDNAVTQLADQTRQIRAQYLPRPTVDGSYPFGYSIVDSRGFIRYYTIDPEFSSLSKELHTMLAATP